MSRSKVVFPEPLGPRKATISPVSIFRLTSLTAGKAPKLLVSEVISMLIGKLGNGD